MANNTLILVNYFNSGHAIGRIIDDSDSVKSMINVDDNSDRLFFTVIWSDGLLPIGTKCCINRDSLDNDHKFKTVSESDATGIILSNDVSEQL